MANPTTPTLDDLAHVWGGDLQTSASGDLLRVSGVPRTQQRLLRRVMTAEDGQEYVWERDYGAGAPQRIGENLDPAEIAATFAGQLALEAAVAQTPAPKITVTAIPSGVSVAVQYFTLADKQPVSLSFKLTQ